MSFILDALKKSETERQRQAGPALLEMRIVRPARRLPIWAVVVGVLLIISVAALAWLAWRPSGAPAPAPAPDAAASTLKPTNPMAASSVDVPPAVAEPSVAPEASASAAAATTVVPQAQPAPGASDDNPADTAPAVAPPAGAARAGADTASLHSYAELGGTLPELRLDLHVYAANPAERYAFINMHKVREGDVTVEGVQVREITRDGVVLDYRGTEFLLGRQ